MALSALQRAAQREKEEEKKQAERNRRPEQSTASGASQSALQRAAQKEHEENTGSFIGGRGARMMDFADTARNALDNPASTILQRQKEQNRRQEYNHLSGMDLGQKRLSLDELNKQLSAADREWREASNAISQWDYIPDGQLEQLQADLAEKESRYDELNRQAKEMQKEIRKAERVQLGIEYEKLRDSSDFASTASAMRESKPAAAIPVWQGNLAARNIVRSIQMGDMSWLSDQYEYMTEDQKDTLLYFAGRGEWDEASKYLDYIEDELNQKAAAAQMEKMTGIANEHPILGSLASVPASLLGGVVGSVDLIVQNARRAITGEPVDYNSEGQRIGSVSEQLREPVQRRIEDNTDFSIGGVNVPGLLYGTAMSGLDSLAAGGIAKSPAVAGLILSGNAGASNARDVASRGGNDNQALAGGIAAGAFEALFESVSIGNLEAMKEVPVTGVKDIVMNVAKSAGVNASEEAATEIANIVFDSIAMGDVSNWNISIRQYMAQGMSEDEAKKQTAIDMFKQVLEAGAGGAIMGVGFGGIGSAHSAVMNRGYVRETTNIGTDFNGMGNDMVQPIIDEGLASDPSTRSYQLARQLQQKLDSGETITNAELGRLYQANVQAIDAEDASGDILLRAANEVTQKGRVTNSTAAGILDNPSAMNTLAQEAGLSVTDDMSKAQQRKAVKSAVEGLARARETAAGATADTATTRQETAAESAQARPVAQQAHDIKRMQQAASVLGENGEKALNTVYDGSAASDSFFAGFVAYYEAGVSGVDMSKVRSEYSAQLNQAQKFAAYAAGQNDAQVSLARTAEPHYTNFNENVEGAAGSDGEATVYLRNGSERADGADTGGELRPVAEGTGRDQSWEVSGRPADSGASALSYGQAVSTASLGIGKGAANDSIRLIAGGETEAMKSAKALASERGLRITFFAGSNLTIQDGEHAVSTRAYISGDRAFIRVDHPEYTADQLMRHEAGHDMIAKGEINQDQVRQRINDTFGKEKTDALAGQYEAAYRGSGLTADEVWEEVICDSLGDMNIFHDIPVLEDNAKELLEETRASSVADLEANRTRGPPPAEQSEAERYGITDDETAALLSYKSSESYKVNAKLRDGLALTETEQKMVAELDSALEKLPKVNGTVYRTLNFDDVFNPQEEYDAFIAQHAEGNFVFYNSYTSTSTKTDGYPLADGAKYGVTLEITSRNARDLAGFGNNFESEALFPRGAEFDIKKVTTDKNGRTYIYMEEMQNYGEGDQPDHDTQKRGVAVRGVQEAHPAHDNLQGAPQGHTDGDQIRESDLRGAGGKVSEDGKYSQDLAELDALRKENERLKGKVDHWKGQLKQTTPETRTLMQVDVDKLARSLINEYDCTLDASTISGKLKSMGEFIIRGGDGKDGLTWAGVHEKSLDIARDLVENAVVMNDDMYREYSDLRNYLRTAKIIYGKEYHGDIPDYGDFRKSQFGRLNLGSDGKTNIDQIYQELSSSWPEFFDEQAQSHPTDQLLHIVDVLDGLQPIYENPYSYDMAAAEEYAAGDILDRLIGEDVRQEPPTYADKQARKLEEEKAKARQQVQKVREQANERLLRQREQSRQRVQDAISRERRRRDEKVRQLKDHYAEVRQNQASRRADSKARTRLLNIARRLQNKKLPAVNRALLDQYIGDLDTVSKGITGKTLEKLSDLQAWYNDRKENDPDFISDPNIERALARLAKRHIADMTADEVADLTSILLNIENELRTEHKLIDEADRRDTYHLGQETIQNIYNTKGSSSVLDKFIVAETLSPVRQVRRMTGYVDSDPLYKLTQSLADGQRSMLDYQMKAERPFEKFAADKAFSRAFSGPKAESIQIAGLTHDGIKTVTITPAMRVSLYLHSLNDQNLRHIKEGGITVPDEKLYRKGKLEEAYARGTTIKLTPSQVRSITASMTEKEKAFARAAQKYFNETSRVAINETSEKLKGYSLAQVDNYFPINTDKNFTRSEFETLKRDGTIEGMGFLKERIRASNPILLRDANAVLEQAIRMHGKYVGLAIPVRNFNKVWNVTTGSYNKDGSRSNYDSSVQQAINQRWGETGYGYIEKLMTDLQGGSAQKNVWVKALNKVRSNYAGAVLTLNLSVAMKQAASYPTAAAVLGWKPLARAMADFGKVDLARIEKYTPLQWYRSKGFSTKELGDLKTADRQLPYVLNWVQGVDLLTTRKLWKASEYYVRQNNKGLTVGTDEYWRAVADIYNRVIEETQPNYTTMQRPQLLRSDDTLMGNLAMFKTQPFQNFNIVYDAAYNFIAKSERAKFGGEQEKADVKKARTDLGHAITSQLAQLAVFAGMTMVWALLRGRKDKYEDDEGDMTISSILTALGKDMVGGALSSVPFGSDAWELLSSKLFGDTYYGMDAVTVTAISDTIQSLSTLVEQVVRIAKNASTGKDTDWNAERLELDSELDDISKAAGVPYENVVNMFKIVFRSAAIASQGEYLGGYAYLKLTTDPQKYASDYYDLLYKSMQNSKSDYEIIYADMVASGITEEKIRNAMETRMKDAKGVTSVDDLEQRYLTPAQQVSYDQSMSSVRGSDLWKRANEEQRDSLEDRLYDLTVMNRSGEDMREKLSDASVYGIDEMEFLLYNLALEMYDTPNKNGEYGGTPTSAEKADAIMAIGDLTDSEIAWLWGTDAGFEAYAGGVDMSAYVEYVGSGGSVSIDKLIDAQDQGIDTSTYFDFLDMLDKYDQPTESGKYGSFTQAEATAAISAMTGLTREQKAYLWQSVNKGWKETNNPWR